jgi:membrane-associated protease RseP (regulator of RpoE activity)
MMRNALFCMAMLLSADAMAGVAPGMTAAEKAQIMVEIEQEIERARREIDVAAQELAKLHKQKYALGGASNKAMLGVLLDGADASGGLQIVGVTPGGGAAAAGMQAGDRVIGIGGVSVEEEPHPRKALAQVMQKVEPGDDVEVVYLRGDQRVTANITTKAHSVHMLTLLDERIGDKMVDLQDLELELESLGPEIHTAIADIPAGERRIIVHRSAGRWLMAVAGELASYFDVDAGVVVREDVPDAELRPGDVLLKIGDTEVTDVHQAAQLLADLQGDTEVEVKRHGRERLVTAKPGQFAGLSALPGVDAIGKVIHVVPDRGEVAPLDESND